MFFVSSHSFVGQLLCIVTIMLLRFTFGNFCENIVVYTAKSTPLFQYNACRVFQLIKLYIFCFIYGFLPCGSLLIVCLSNVNLVAASGHICIYFCFTVLLLVQECVHLLHFHLIFLHLIFCGLADYAFLVEACKKLVCIIYFYLHCCSTFHYHENRRCYMVVLHY